MVRNSKVLAFTVFGVGTVIAQSDSQADYTGVTFPWVDYAINNAPDDFATSYFNYPATSLGSHGAETTYGLHCDDEPTSMCFGLEGWTSMTLITSPKTLEVIFNQPSSYASTGCVLTGSPFPTTGTCSETYTTANGTLVETSATTYTIPNASTDDWGNVYAEGIYTATLGVLEGGVVTTTAGTLTSGTNTGTRTGSNVVASRTSTPTENGVTSTGVGGGSTQASGSSTSRNAAMITGAPSWVLIAGALAGAAVGV